ncbi:MAG: serine O-acetyltransferase [Clostridia bacterium]|nr:serine O-acetyltransferase [Clostridia bacterium]
MFKRIREDLNAYQERDPAAKSKAQIFFLYNGFHAVLGYRLAHWLYRHKRYFLARWVSQYTKFRTGVEIHPAATIGRKLCIDHGTGIVIGETCIIGDNCLLYQGVTLGGTGKETGKRHPTLEDNVIVGSGAKVLGPFTIGSHSKIAANAVVLEEIPPYSTAVGVPAKVVRQNGKKVEADPLDQVHIPDPIAQELQRLNQKIEELEARLKEKENETV